MDEEILEVTPKAKNNLALSNVFISSKYQATIKELKLTYLSLLKIQQGNYDKKPDGLYVTMRGAEIKKALGVKGNGIYSQLVETAEMMTGRTVGLVDPTAQTFDFVSIITRATYENSELKIRFANEMEAFICNLERNFTYLPKDIMLSFKKEYSFKLYEVLKSYAYYPTKYQGNKNGMFKIEIALAELKLTLGIINSNLDSVKKVLKGTHPNYEKAVEKAPEKMYEDWYEFRRKILDKAIKEINELSDIEVEYKSISGGVGGKIVAVEFNILLKSYKKEVEIDEETSVVEEEKKTDILSEDDKFEIECEVKGLLEFSVKLKDIRTICDAASYDMERIKKAYAVMKHNTNDIDNPVGYLLKAIKEEWEVPEKFGNKKKLANDFNNFKQSTYDQINFDEYEESILSN